MSSFYYIISRTEDGEGYISAGSLPFAPPNVMYKQFSAPGLRSSRCRRQWFNMMMGSRIDRSTAGKGNNVSG